MRMRLALPATIAATVAMAALFAAQAGAAPDNSLACELLAESSVKAALGVSHVNHYASATSPTAPEPNDHTVEGADQSVCEFFGYDQKPSKQKLAQARKARKPVPAGLGFVVLTTEVADPEAGEGGEEWDPTAATLTWSQGLNIDRKALGGDSFPSPGFGSFLHATDWLGHRDRNSGFYEVGDGSPAASGVIVLSVSSPDPTHSVYKKLAKKVVPAFTNVILSP